MLKTQWRLATALLGYAVVGLWLASVLKVVSGFLFQDIWDHETLLGHRLCGHMVLGKAYGLAYQVVDFVPTSAQVLHYSFCLGKHGPESGREVRAGPRRVWRRQ